MSDIDLKTTRNTGDGSISKHQVWFMKVFAVVVILANLVVLTVAWRDRSWLAMCIAIIYGPMLNGAFMVAGLVAIPFLKRQNGFRLAEALALSLVLPIVAIVIDLGLVMLMGLHGC